MNNILNRVKHEVLQVIPPAIFFFIAFQVIAFTQALMLEQYGIRVTTFITATIAALVVAKVVLIADMIPLINRFPEKPLMYNVAWKTLVYNVVALFVRYVEHLIPFVREHGSLTVANRQLIS